MPPPAFDLDFQGGHAHRGARQLHRFPGDYAILRFFARFTQGYVEAFFRPLFRWLLALLKLHGWSKQRRFLVIRELESEDKSAVGRRLINAPWASPLVCPRPGQSGALGAASAPRARR